MKNSLKLSVMLFAFLAAFQSCNRKVKEVASNDDLTSGTIKFVVDESFQPIVDEELYVFTKLYPNAKPSVIYRTENEGLRLLLNDSARFAILSRALKPDELKVLNSRTLPAVINCFAIDAVAIIVNEASTDTNITVGEIKKMLNGDTKQDRNIVFDNPNSSLVRYLKDLSGNKELKQKKVYALKSNKEVLEYVSTHANAIGITGFSWLNDPDKDYAEAVKKVKIVSVRDEGSKAFANQYFTPSQSTLALKQYPLSRSLYIINCTGKQGLGTGFASFLLGVRGQKIILKSGLLPDSIPQREINITHQLKQ
ncbi:substrate-binding domain-containing protein [soil metagenome]